jgi:DNA-binding MarR family transcriptional regulator
MPGDNQFVDRLHEWFEILRRTLMGNFFAYARDNGLTMPQFGAMFRIYHSEACGVSDIGTSLGVTNSAASQMLERLVQLKLITRSEDPTDRRVKQLVLTDKGRQIIMQTTTAYHAWMEDLAGSMTAEEIEQVDKGLAILIEKAHQIKMSAN